MHIWLNKLCVFTTILVVITAFDTNAYEVITHRKMSEAAVEKSYLGTDDALLTRFGLQPYSTDPVFPSPETGINKTILMLISDGAQFEDQMTLPRPVNHFYDPFYNRGLTIDLPFNPLLPLTSQYYDFPIEVAHSSPNWALEDQYEVDPLVILTNEVWRQDNSYRDAIDQLFSALTLPTQTERNQSWGMLFQSLGQIIHHIQDMAQPEHVRNDPHPPHLDPSGYENYTEGRLNTQQIRDLITNGAYPIPEFDSPREFWTTRDIDAVDDRQGMADFSNYNFVSNNANYQLMNGQLAPNAEYPHPVPKQNLESLNLSDPQILGSWGQTLCGYLKQDININPAAGDCFIDFIQSDVTDNYLSKVITPNVNTASLSVFDNELTIYNKSVIVKPYAGNTVTVDRVPTINQFNYKEMHNYLLPRAVSYSAGLIDHFFKANFEVTVDHVSKSFVFKNLSGSIMKGEYSLYVETIESNNRILKQSWNIADTFPGGLVADGELSVTVSDLSLYKSSLYFVYRGELDNEVDTEHVSGYNTNFDNRISGVQSAMRRQEPPHYVELKINTYLYSNMQLSEFNSYVKITSNDNYGEDNDYEIHNYHWRVNPPGSDYYCYIEVVGDWVFNSTSYLDGDDLNVMYWDHSWNAGLKSHNILNNELGILAEPSDTECLAAPYGYRSTIWSHGWISKYSSVAIPTWSDGLGLLIDSGMGLGSDVVYLVVPSMIVRNSSGTCVDPNIQDIKDNWTPNSSAFGQIELTHAFADQNELLADDPFGYLTMYIPSRMTDYSCQ